MNDNKFKPVFFVCKNLIFKHKILANNPQYQTVFILCVVFTLIWARIAARFANKATPETLNRATGIILVILGIVVLGFSML